MAYVEAFLLYVAVVLFMFVVLFGSVAVVFVVLGYAQKLKSKWFKLAIVTYFAIFAFFYVNQAIRYFADDRAYPKAKAYAIVANTVMLWHSLGVNIRMKKGFESYYRLVNYENPLDRKIQKIQSFLLQRMYRYIPEEDGEREYWYYTYKQLYVAKIRYKPDSPHNPHPRFSKIMDAMYDTSYKLYNKPFKDRIIDKKRYLPIAQMSVYLMRNIGYYATYERMQYLDKLFLFMSDKELFQRAIDYTDLLYKVYKKFRTDKEVARTFHRSPYSLGLLYASLLDGYDLKIIHNAHFGIDPCSAPEMRTFLHLVEEYYEWIFKDPRSSFHQLSRREKKQIKWLYGAKALAYSYAVGTYLCEIPLKYKDDRRLFPYDDERILPVIQKIDDYVMAEYTIKFTNLQPLIDRREAKKQKPNEKDK